MPLKKITDIATELKESLSADIAQNYRYVFIPKNITAILEERGYVRKGANGSRLPTQKGNALGISTERRVKPDTGEEYLQVLYNEAAAAYVRTMLFEVYPEIDPSKSNEETHPAYDGEGRATVDKIRKKHDVEIVILKCEDGYRAYDESAQKLCDVLGTEPYRNRDGCYGARIKTEDLPAYVVPLLKERRIPFAVNDTELVLYRYAVPSPVLARIGCVLTLRDDSGESFRVFLSGKEFFETKAFTRVDGTIEITRVPITKKDGIIILHPDSPIFEELIGKQTGETIVFNGVSYTIRSIENDGSF